MIIDAHAHTNGGNLGTYKAGLLSSRALAQGNFHQSEDQLRPAVENHIKTIMDAAGHRNVGVCWNSNQTDLEGEGFEHNFDLVKNKIIAVHLRDLFLEEYPFRKLFTRLNAINYTGFCLAEIPPSDDPVRVMKYFRGLWLSYQGLL